MSHEISEIDRQQGIEQAWHGKTEVMPVISLASCWLTTWDVKKLIMGVMAMIGGISTFVKSEFCQLVCDDDESIALGKPVHCETYSVLSNRAFLAIVQNSLDKIRGAVVASVGSVCRRTRIFVTLQMPELPAFTAAGREFKPYLNFLSSHDRSAPFLVNLSTICTVCNNTFSMNLADDSNKELRIRIKHTSGMAEALEDVPAIIDAFYASAQRFADVLNRLAKLPITANDARNFFAAFLTEKDADKADELSTRKLNQIDRLTMLFATGKGNNGANLADLFSAVTDYYSHESAGGTDNPDRQIASSEFGNGATMKALAFAILSDEKNPDRVPAMVAKGKTVLANHESAVAAREAKERANHV